MTQYVLRPEPILPQVPLIDGLLWIANNKYPEHFADISVPEENPAYEYICDLAANDDDINMDFFDKNTTSLFFVLEQIKNRELIETATHKMFTAISDKKIKLYGLTLHTEPGGKTLDYDIIDPTLLKYSDFDWFNARLIIDEQKYAELLIDTQGLFEAYPVILTQSNFVSYGANNYFIDDTNNNEVKIEIRGRRPKLSPEQIAAVGARAKDYLQKNPDAPKKALVFDCINYVYKKFGISVPESTMKDYLSKIKQDEN